MAAKELEVKEALETEAVVEEKKQARTNEAKKAVKDKRRSPSKRYLSLNKKVANQDYAVGEAVKLVKENANAKFDETIEAHFRLGIDPKQTSQQVRGTVTLPHGTGQIVRVLVFAEGDQAKAATQAGATVINQSILEQIAKGSIPYDVVIATPDQMPTIAKFARVLGVRGLMPNPKNDTVTTDVAKTIATRSSGLIDFKNSDSLIHARIGKASFSEEALTENLVAFYRAVLAAKPAKTTKEYIRSIHIASTMGPGVRVDRSTILEG